MATHNGEKHPESSRLKDSPEFKELAGLMAGIPPDRREAAFAAAEIESSKPPALKLFDDDSQETLSPTPENTAGRTPASD